MKKILSFMILFIYVVFSSYVTHAYTMGIFDYSNNVDRPSMGNMINCYNNLYYTTTSNNNTNNSCFIKCFSDDNLLYIKITKKYIIKAFNLKGFSKYNFLLYNFNGFVKDLISGSNILKLHPISIYGPYPNFIGTIFILG